MAELVRLTQIAERLSVNRSTVERLLKRAGPDLGILSTKGKQNVIFLKREDADRLIAYYEAHTSRQAGKTETEQVFQKFGFFYVIQLVPEAISNRVKIGYTDNVDARLAEHRTAAPTAKLVKSWPCKRSWDYAAMDSIIREDCVLVLNEVYEGNVEGFIRRGDAFFGIMPGKSATPRLSDYSPLQQKK